MSSKVNIPGSWRVESVTVSRTQIDDTGIERVVCLIV